MDYTVRAQFKDGPRMTRVDTPNQAYAAGRQLEADGATSVVIQTPEGTTHTVSEFWQSLSTGRPV